MHAVGFENRENFIKIDSQSFYRINRRNAVRGPAPAFVNGVLDKLMPVPIPLKWGAPSAGGPMITAGGLIFIGATADSRFRAYDIDTGQEVWQFELPTSAMAAPMTYEAGGRQFVVIAAGGHSWYYANGIDDYLIAFALPESP